MKLEEKEIIGIKKMYLEQIEKFDSKIYFTFLSLSITLVVLYLTSKINSFLQLGVGLFFFIIIIEIILNCRRRKMCNDLIDEIKSGEIKRI